MHRCPAIERLDESEHTHAVATLPVGETRATVVDSAVSARVTPTPASRNAAGSAGQACWSIASIAQAAR